MAKKLNKNLAIALEGSIWIKLDEIKKLELIILKGHLYLEILIDNILEKNNIEKHLEFSFYYKVKALKVVIENSKAEVNDEIIFYLFALNKIRNRLAHEYEFDIADGEIEKWSNNVLSKFRGNKFSKFTYRTKIVHAFSGLGKALTEIN